MADQAVVDRANILGPDQEQALARQLDALQSKYHHRVIILTVASLEGKDIGRFADDYGNGLGIRDGVILLVAPQEKRARISVTSGLNVQLTDAMCQTIMDREMIPNFRRNGYAAGLMAAIAALEAKFAAIG